MKQVFILLVLLVFIPVHAETTREDGAHKLAIDLAGSLQNPAFSPDGKVIVFTNFHNGYNKGPADLYTFDLATQQLHLLVKDGSDNVNLPGHVWLNNSIVFSSAREPHDEIYMIREDGSPGDEQQITSRIDLVGYEPSFSSDGAWIVFESHVLDRENDGVITKVRTDGSSGYVALTSTNINAKQPNFSPTDDIIVYQQEQNEQWDLWLVNADGSNNRQLTKNMGSCTDASFSADGNWIVFSREIPETDAANLYRISINGSIVEKLTTFSGYDGAPSYFAPYIVFESTDGDPDRSSGTTIWLRDTSKSLIASYDSDEAMLDLLFPLNALLVVYVYRKISKHKTI